MSSKVLVIMLLLNFGAYASDPVSMEEWHKSDLSWQLPADEITELLAGDKSFLALKRAAFTAKVKGTILFVPDWSQHASSPKYLNLLRKEFNDYGWDTLAIAVPDAPAENDTPSLDSYKEQLQQRIAVAMTSAMAENSTVIVVAQGSSAALISQLYADKKLQEPQSLILLEAYLPQAEQQRSLPLAIAKQQVPTLDLMQQQGNQQVAAQWQLRKQLAIQQQKLLYRQREISGLVTQSETQQRVFKEIHGWLSYQGY
ncbi:MAG: alpha/beta hydrolase family protein [Pararheinheimera sp.]|nr:alpha/beta hydrolase family protein [Rheinheimera sp.]